MSDIFFTHAKILGEDRIIVFRRGELVTPLFAFDKQDIEQFLKEITELKNELE